ncbi:MULTISPECIES: hypothetical protein [unclassified Leptotrichia]|uniref:hypothetical protein n=1 Tax=unclassified Leptotrichia TaxID=2633022 RepID=UPI0003AD8BA6|nr:MULTISPECIES: hypothetical protein [unclassified Leptotrichia]ERL03325.1 hypothetical protein HMPREF9108_02378 [Leptotrichia sp. oral taxon 225 str. F0581]WLD74412.1 hypothetical protein QU666_00645 [Leptotrichia sp. HMT-225]
MKEKILGKIVGKAGISQVMIIKTIFIIAICIILGFFLVILSLVNWGKNYFEFLFWIGIFIISLAPIQFLWLKMEESSVGKYIFYETGFENVLKKEKIFFEDVKNYFYLNLKNGSDNVEFLVIEVENKENLINNNLEKITINLELNRMASRLFVKNYIEFVLKNKFNEDTKNKDNFDFKFGIIEKNNLMKDKIFSLNMDKNLEKVKISEYIFLDKNEIRVGNQNEKILENYFWKEIGKITVLENKNNKNIQIEKKTGEVIFSKNMKYIEKPELFIKIIKNIFI